MSPVGGNFGGPMRPFGLWSRPFAPRCRTFVFLFSPFWLYIWSKKKKGGHKSLLFVAFQSLTGIRTVFPLPIPVVPVLIPVAKKCFAAMKMPLSRRFLH
ncbi:MAG: hypothetical protein ACI3YA_08355 [Alloprevotella sp.]